MPRARVCITYCGASVAARRRHPWLASAYSGCFFRSPLLGGLRRPFLDSVIPGLSAVFFWIVRFVLLTQPDYPVEGSGPQPERITPPNNSINVFPLSYYKFLSQLYPVPMS